MVGRYYAYHCWIVGTVGLIYGLRSSDSTVAAPISTPTAATSSCGSLSPQCSETANVWTLFDTSRSVAFNDGNGGVEYCDNDISNTSPDWKGLGWYRIGQPAGNQMPETPQPEYACGTESGGWLNGTHPDVADGVVTRNVCFHFNGDLCSFSNHIQVVNCCDHYRYKLKPLPVCRLRYCAE